MPPFNSTYLNVSEDVRQKIIATPDRDLEDWQKQIKYPHRDYLMPDSPVTTIPPDQRPPMYVPFKPSHIRREQAEQAFASLLAKGLKPHEAYLALHPDTEISKAVIAGVRYSKKQGVQEKLARLLKRKISLQTLVETHAAQLVATKPVTQYGTITDTYPDNQARMEAVKQGYKLYGIGTDDQQQAPQVNITFQKEDIAALDDIAERLARLEKQDESIMIERSETI